MQDYASSKISQSESFLVATKREVVTENVDSSMSSDLKDLVSSNANATKPAAESIAAMRADTTSVVSPPTITVTLSGVLDFLHISSFSNASDEEAIFFYSLFLSMQGKAKRLAQEANGTCDRAYHAFLLSINKVGV
ncbi:MAG: hypothetical protein WBE72_08850 [Terracidiphilus sp.]